MDFSSLYSIFWTALIAIDLILARKLFKMYQKDSDVQKLMFTIGLLMCMPVYALAILGINSFPFAINIFSWSPLPILLAFIFTLMGDRFNLDLKHIFKLYFAGVILTFVLFFVPLKDISLIFLLSGGAFAIFLSILQCSRKFDIASVLLFLAIPAFAICFASIPYNMIELALFAGFAAKASLILAFEASKRHSGESSSILVLKKKLGVAEQNFSKLFSILPDPAVIVDSKGTFLALTSSITQTGYQKEELLGNNFLTTELITAHSKALLIKNLAKRMLGFQIPPYEIEIKTKDGKILQFELNALKIEYDGNPADMVILRDFTERKKLIKSLEDEQERFQNIAENTGDWIWEVDSKGNYIYSNPLVEKILGYTPEEIIGKKFCDFLLPCDKNKMSGFFLAFSSGNCQLGEIKRCLRKDGRVSITETRGMPVYGADRKIAGYRGVDRDVTDKKEMEERLLKSERFAAIGELATMVAHDLRNPLQGIANALYFVKRTAQKTGDDKTIVMVQRIDDAVKYSEKIIRDLLDYSADIKLEIVETDPHSIVNRVLKGIVVPDRIELINRTQNNPKVYVDFEKIRLVIVNLVTNAFDAMPSSGTLTIISEQKEDNLELSVSDNGFGIPVEKLERLWYPFFTTKAKGMGLGLPICKRIVEAHGGQILVESETGKGTTFKLELPIKVPEKNDVEFFVRERSLAEEPSENQRILKKSALQNAKDVGGS